MAFSDELIVSFSGDGAFELFTMRLYSTYCKKSRPPGLPCLYRALRGLMMVTLAVGRG